MAYRSDKEARLARKDSLERELKEIREALDADVEVEAPKRSILDAATVANPCPKSWAEMKGDDKVRFCGGCKKNVYNVIAMGRVEAEELLAQGDVCARLFRRPDGTVMTADCAPGRWRRRGQKAVAIAAAAGLAAGAVYGASKLATSSDDESACDNPPIPAKMLKPRKSMLKPNTATPQNPVEIMGDVAIEPPPHKTMGVIAIPQVEMGEVEAPPSKLMGRIKVPTK